MTSATMTHPSMAHQPTHLRGKVLFLLVLLTLGGLAYGLYWFLHRPHQLRAVTSAMENTAWPAWLKQPVKYEPGKAEPPAVSPAARDLQAERLAELQRKLDEQQAQLDALKRQPAKAPAAVQAHAPKLQRTSMLFLTPPAPEPAKNGDAPGAPMYLLAPGATKIPCQIETAMHSDVEGYFTAKTRVGVYDTPTGQHLLIPQNSTILGHDQSSQLLYGNERMNTMSLTLALPDGTSYDLGKAPVTDQQGVAGLTGEVTNHWWRLLGAVIVTGALRGGQQALQQAAAGAGGADTVAVNIAGQGGQAGTRALGRAMDTRPTITVEAGQLCNVILLKPLTLPAVRT